MSTAEEHSVCAICVYMTDILAEEQASPVRERPAVLAASSGKYARHEELGVILFVESRKLL